MEEAGEEGTLPRRVRPRDQGARVPVTLGPRSCWAGQGRAWESTEPGQATLGPRTNQEPATGQLTARTNGRSAHGHVARPMAGRHPGVNISPGGGSELQERRVSPGRSAPAGGRRVGSCGWRT
jgi:hypothetical protein